MPITIQNNPYEYFSSYPKQQITCPIFPFIKYEQLLNHRYLSIWAWNKQGNRKADKIFFIF